MAIYLYDGSFEGLLSCVFASYTSKVFPLDITPEDGAQFGLLDEIFKIECSEIHAKRVLAGVDARTNDRAGELVYKLFLSELPGREMMIYRLIKIIIAKNDATVLENFADETILKAAQIDKMINREVHRMHAFVRFQKTQQGIFYAPIEPDFNVVPLLGDHFERRYADQPWVIFDTRRHYGIYYDLTKAEFIAADHPALGATIESVDDSEKTYQMLWENYFHSVNIKERNNPKLHLRHMPKRYWKYLVEKKVRR